MNLYIVLCQAFAFTILIIQHQFIKEVAATKEHQPAVGNWFNSLEKKLNFTEHIFEEVVVDRSDSDISSENDVMHDVFQGARATVWEIQPDPLKNNEDIIDKDNGGKKAYDLFKSREIQENSVAGIDVSDGNIPGERDVMHDVFQEVRATAWEAGPDTIKNTEDVIDKYSEARKAYDQYKNPELQENSMPQIEVNDLNKPGDRDVSSVYIHSETTPFPKFIRKKKIRKIKKKNHKLKPKRLRVGKNKKDIKKQEHMKKKQHPKKKLNSQARKNNIYEPKLNVSEHLSENNSRGKPVDIIVHIKMNE